MRYLTQDVQVVLNIAKRLSVLLPDRNYSTVMAVLGYITVYSNIPFDPWHGRRIFVYDNGDIVVK